MMIRMWTIFKIQPNQSKLLTFVNIKFQILNLYFSKFKLAKLV